MLFKPDILKGKTALVTGGATGIGLQLARGLAKCGATVVIASRNEKNLAHATKDMRAEGGDAHYRLLDIRQDEMVYAVVSEVIESFGKIDILVNNAGILVFSAVQDTSNEDFARVFDVNVKSVFYGTKYILPAMKAAGGGSIVNISSIAAWEPTVFGKWPKRVARVVAASRRLGR